MKKYETVINDDGSKTHYVNRSATDKAIYKPMNSFIYQKIYLIKFFFKKFQAKNIII